MRIAVACGGTGGHIFPGLATAQELTKRGHEVSLWLAGRDVEGDSVREWSGPVVALKARGLSGGVGSRARALAGMLKTVCHSLQLMRRQRPDVVVAMGAYSSVGPGLAAGLLRIPLVLHEGNAVPGRAMRLLAPFAATIGTGFPALRGLPARKTIYCGFPVRAAFSEMKKCPADPPLLLVTGGSQGAAILNRVVPEAIRTFVKSGGPALQVVHVSGKGAYDVVREQYKGLEHMVRVEAFSHEMPALYAAASIAITRAGAATCTELAVAKVPAILVPYAAAAGNHQWYNAKSMVDTGGFALMDESACDAASLASSLHTFLSQPERLAHMQRALPGPIVSDGAANLANLVEQTAS